MAILGFLAIWAFYFWLVHKLLRRSVAGIKAGGRNDIEARLRRSRVQIPDTVPSEWIDAYRAENDA
jgi:hypothetical protein